MSVMQRPPMMPGMPPNGTAGSYPALAQLLAARNRLLAPQAQPPRTPPQMPPRTPQPGTAPGSFSPPGGAQGAPPRMPPASPMASGAPPFSGSMPPSSQGSPSSGPSPSAPAGGQPNWWQMSGAQQAASLPGGNFLYAPDKVNNPMYAGFYGNPNGQMTAQQEQNQAQQQQAMADFRRRIAQGGQNTALTPADAPAFANGGLAAAMLQYGGINGRQGPPPVPPAAAPAAAAMTGPRPVQQQQYQV